MNNKGFTLIELIVTIGLIAILSVTVGVSMSGMLSRQKDSEIDEYVKKIEKAACTYAQITNNNTNFSVNIKTLIEKGLINKNETNPCSNKKISNYQNNTVSITLDGQGERSCKYILSPEEGNCKSEDK